MMKWKKGEGELQVEKVQEDKERTLLIITNTYCVVWYRFSKHNVSSLCVHFFTFIFNFIRLFFAKKMFFCKVLARAWDNSPTKIKEWKIVISTLNINIFSFWLFLGADQPLQTTLSVHVSLRAPVAPLSTCFLSCPFRWATWCNSRIGRLDAFQLTLKTKLNYA